MAVRLTRHARLRARQREIPIELIEQVHDDPDLVRPSTRNPDREIRSRVYHGHVIEVVVDIVDGKIVSVWHKSVPR